MLRPGRWALPPQPPESWTSGPAALSLFVAIATSLVLPPATLLPHGRSTAAAYVAVLVVEGVLTAFTTYLLLLQSAIAQDRRLLWAAGGFGLLWALTLARALGPEVTWTAPYRGTGDVSTALSVAWVVILPTVVLTAGLRHRTTALLAVPAVLVTCLTLALAHVDTTAAGGLRSAGRVVLTAAVALAVAAAVWWRRRVPQGNRGAWGWVGSALLLVPVVAVLRQVSGEDGAAPVWAPWAVEILTLTVTALGLAVLTLRGFWPQARRWRLLETEVRQLRSASPLLPGLSVTPLDESGLPERDEVADTVARGAAQVALQPVRDLLTLDPLGQEALARFGGRVPTDRWFRAAAMHGLGAELECLTLGAALRCLKDLPSTQFLAVNTSPASLEDERVLALLLAVDLSRVVVEITEHDAVRDYALMRRTLSDLRAAGARIAVDDVGAGFASLRHVLQLQPDLVKLDTSLTRDVHVSARQRALVRAVVQFADEVGAQVLAEGIEINEQLAPLIDAGVTLGQGWHLGRPVICT